jgi:hypothetical protein
MSPARNKGFAVAAVEKHEEDRGASVPKAVRVVKQTQSSTMLLLLQLVRILGTRTRIMMVWGKYKVKHI